MRLPAFMGGKKEPEKCFFCQADLEAEQAFTIQYTSQEGLHSVKICRPCGQTFNEISDIVDHDLER